MSILLNSFVYNYGEYGGYNIIYDTYTPSLWSMFGGLFFLIILGLVLNIILLVWVAKDAKRRGMDNPILWMLLALITGFLGLIIYFLVRPKGNIVKCKHCGNKKLEYLKICPSCGR